VDQLSIIESDEDHQDERWIEEGNNSRPKKGEKRCSIDHLDFFRTDVQTWDPSSRERRKKRVNESKKSNFEKIAQHLGYYSYSPHLCCFLCGDPLMDDNVLTTPCKHYFHRHCVLQRLEKPHCPLCEEELPFEWFLGPRHPLAKRGYRICQCDPERVRFSMKKLSKGNILLLDQNCQSEPPAPGDHLRVDLRPRVKNNFDKMKTRSSSAHNNIKSGLFGSDDFSKLDNNVENNTECVYENALADKELPSIFCPETHLLTRVAQAEATNGGNRSDPSSEGELKNMNSKSLSEEGGGGGGSPSSSEGGGRSFLAPEDEETREERIFRENVEGLDKLTGGVPCLNCGCYTLRPAPPACFLGTGGGGARGRVPRRPRQSVVGHEFLLTQSAARRMGALCKAQSWAPWPHCGSPATPRY